MIFLKLDMGVKGSYKVEKNRAQRNKYQRKPPKIIIPEELKLPASPKRPKKSDPEAIFRKETGILGNNHYKIISKSVVALLLAELGEKAFEPFGNSGVDRLTFYILATIERMRTLAYRKIEFESMTRFLLPGMNFNNTPYTTSPPTQPHNPSQEKNDDNNFLHEPPEPPQTSPENTESEKNENIADTLPPTEQTQTIPFTKNIYSLVYAKIKASNLDSDKKTFKQDIKDEVDSIWGGKTDLSLSVIGSGGIQKKRWDAYEEFELYRNYFCAYGKSFGLFMEAEECVEGGDMNDGNSGLYGHERKTTGQIAKELTDELFDEFRLCDEL